MDKSKKQFFWKFKKILCFEGIFKRCLWECFEMSGINILKVISKLICKKNAFAGCLFQQERKWKFPLFCYFSLNVLQLFCYLLLEKGGKYPVKSWKVLKFWEKFVWSPCQTSTTFFTVTIKSFSVVIKMKTSSER